MVALLEKLKDGAGKAQFEADRLRRLNQGQSTLKGLERQLQTDVAAMGTQVLELRDSGALSQPELIEACRQIDSLQQRISAQREDVERIRQEKARDPSGAVLYGQICPRCQIQLPSDAGFCPECGSAAETVAPPAIPASVLCASCGAPLAEGARFCSTCGASVEVAIPAATTMCPACQASIPAGMAFCVSCGTSLGDHPPEDASPAEPVEWEEAPPHSVCLDCQASIPAEAVFCPECGASAALVPDELAEEVADAEVFEPLMTELVETEAPSEEPEEAPAMVSCASCHVSIPADAIFCPECGGPVVAAPEEQQ